MNAYDIPELENLTLEQLQIVQALAREYATNEAVNLANSLIGKPVEVIYEYKDIQDEDSIAEPGSKAVNEYQTKQRAMLASYQDERQAQVAPVEAESELSENES